MEYLFWATSKSVYASLIGKVSAACTSKVAYVATVKQIPILKIFVSIFQTNKQISNLSWSVNKFRVHKG